MFDSIQSYTHDIRLLNKRKNHIKHMLTIPHSYNQSLIFSLVKKRPKDLNLLSHRVRTYSSNYLGDQSGSGGGFAKENG